MKTSLQNLAKTILLFTAICNLQFAFAQAPAIEWQKALGGALDELGGSIKQTTDGGYIVVGQTMSDDADAVGNIGGYSFWVVKLNNLGVLQWQKTFGGNGEDFAQSVQQTTDGGFIVTGYSGSENGDITDFRGFSDFWVVKLSATGTLEWQKSLGGSTDDAPYNIEQTSDGGYIVAGWTSSNDGDVTGYHGNWDFWIVKLNSLGTIQWQKALGGSSTEIAHSIHQTTDGGYIVAGYSHSNNGDVSGNYGGADYWVVKLNNLGAIQWQQILGGSASDIASSIQQTADGGYIVAGTTTSNDGDVTGNHGYEDAWVVKLDATGAKLWQKTLGGTLFDFATDIQQTNDGGYIVAGYSNSSDNDVIGAQGGYDYWIVKLNASGTIQWQKPMGGNFSDKLISIQKTTDNGYVVAGNTSSIDGNITGNHGRYDLWVVKLAADPSLDTNIFVQSNFSIYPNPVKDILTIINSSNISFDRMTITDLVGKKIIEQNGNSNQINVAQLPQGIYLLQITSNGKKSINKFIKQ